MPAELDRSLSRAQPADPTAGDGLPEGAAPAQIDQPESAVGPQATAAPGEPVATTESVPGPPAPAPAAVTPTAPAASAAQTGRRIPPPGVSLAADVGGRLRELTWLAAGVVDLFLVLDFALRAVGPPRDGFVAVVTRTGDALASPFLGIVPATAPRLGLTNDWSLVLAVVIYTLAALVVVRLLAVLLGPAPAVRG
jgi:hypothetical protein